MTLSESFAQLTPAKWKYYSSMGDCEKNNILDNLNKESAKRTITLCTVKNREPLIWLFFKLI